VRIAVLGVGLIGGSIGLAARERLGAEVVGFDPAPGALDAALDVGAVDRAAPDVAGAVAGTGADAADGGVSGPAGLASRSRCQRASFASPSGSAVRASKPTRSRAFFVQAWRRETLLTVRASA
jgi:hypothetical protein